MRDRPRRRRCVPPSRRASSRPRRLGAARSRLDQRRTRERSCASRHAAAAPGRSCRDRLDRDRLRTRMTTLAPVSVALKFGFLAVLYLFLLWVARSALKDLRGGASGGASRGAGAGAGGIPIQGEAIPGDATGLYSASTLGSADVAHRAPRLVV